MDVVEAEETFTLAGFLVFENPLKADSPTTIQELSRVRIRSVMITGDHPFTALHVAKVCSIVGHATLQQAAGSYEVIADDNTPQPRLEAYLLDAETMTWQPVEPAATDHPPLALSMDDFINKLLFDDSIVPVITGAGYMNVCAQGFD